MITLERRNLIHLSAAGFAGAAAGPFAPQAARAATTQSPGFYRFSVGGFEATVLNDGYFELPGDSFATNASAEERRAYFEARSMPLDKVRHQASPLLINTRQRLVLVDTGSVPGTAMAPQAGRLAQSLAAAGVAPEAIDVVVLTHAHPDHIGGLIDPAAKAPRFPKAEVALSDTELGLWTAPDAATRVPGWATATPSLQLAQTTLATLRDRLRPVRPGTDIVTGIQGLHTPGHTPGHLSLLIGPGAGGGERLLVTGDAVPNIHLAFQHPDWQAIWDHDREQGARTRARLLDQMATERFLVAGYHYPFPGIGRVVRDGGGYYWLPADWVWPS
jgi:glyoxylase-like metal-dependent hydrolase (beta-lactamase superfamily II)